MYHTGTIIQNSQIAEQTFHLTVESDRDLPSALPGQFAMLRLPKRTDPLLGRAFAIYRLAHRRFEIVYLTVGKMTESLAQQPTGAALDFWLPLGNGFPKTEVQHTIMVAGGIGQTPFLMLAEKWNPSFSARYTLLYGARTKNRLACVDDFRQTGIDVHIATDDGTAGQHTQVTALIESVYRPGESTQILCCGPKPMLFSAFLVAKKRGLPCFVSLETPMSCGMGICYGCVVPYRVHSETEEWDYRRTCKDGPVFDAYKLQWEKEN